MEIYFAEFVGTAILILLGNGVVANIVLKDTKGNNAGWLAGAIAWCLAVTFAVFTVGRISGAHLNPAVTLGLASIGEFAWGDVPGYLVAQMLGAFCGAVLVFIAYLPHWGVTDDPSGKLACFATAPAIRHTPGNFIAEAMATAMLVFGVLAIQSVAKGAVADDVTVQEGLKICFGNWINPLLVGMLVMSIGLSLGGTTGYSINPARDLAPRIAHAILPIKGKGGSDWGYAWLPVVAPIVGGVLGAFLYKTLGIF